MFQGITGSDPLIFIVNKHLFKQIYSFGFDTMLVAGRHEALEGRLLSWFDNFGDLFGQGQLVTSEILFEVVGAHDVHDAGHLVVVVRSLEERVDIEKEAGHGASERPDV